jgi:hypothetical protein
VCLWLALKPAQTPHDHTLKTAGQSLRLAVVEGCICAGQKQLRSVPETMATLGRAVLLKILLREYEMPTT